MKNQKTSDINSQNTVAVIILVGLILALIFSILILSWVPPVSRDALTHHLAVPKLYIRHGGIYEIPSLLASYYPMNLDLLYMIPLYFGNDILPKLIHFTFTLLTAWLIFGYLKKRLNSVYALLGVLFFLSLPIIVKLSFTVYVDMGLLFFSTVSLLYLLKWIENDFRLKYLIISAIGCGLTIGTKYNGLIILFILTVFVPFAYSHVMYVQKKNSRDSSSDFTLQIPVQNELKSVGYAVIFVIISLMIFSPWGIKNYIWTGNPIYPLYDNLFNPSSSEEDSVPDLTTPENIRRVSVHESWERLVGSLGHFTLRNISYNESWWQIALIPLRIFFQGKDGSPQYFDGKLNPLLFFFPLFAFYGLSSISPSKIEKFEKKIFLAFALLFLVITFFKADMRIRYIVLIIPSFVILSVFGVHEIHIGCQQHFSSHVHKKICIGMIWGMIFFFMTMNITYILNQFKIVEPFSYITGKVGRDEYIEKYCKEYPVVRYANKHLPGHAKILSLFIGKRQYYSDREMFFYPNLFQTIVQHADSPKKIASVLNHNGITHLLIRYDLFATWSDNNFDDMEKERLRIFIREHLNLIFNKGIYGLFALENR